MINDAAIARCPRVNIATWAAAWTESEFSGKLSFFTPLLVAEAIGVLSLPTAIWQHHGWRCTVYQQSIQGWSIRGLWDWVKGEGVEMAISILMVWILFAVIRKSPRRWWFWFWIAAVPLIILGAIIEPVIVEPLFFKFAPLSSAQPHLAESIEQMTIRAGAPIPQSRILEMTASAKLKELNAYVSGMGASKRVVVWDTTIRSMSEGEVLFVTGHEMGHLWFLGGMCARASLIFPLRGNFCSSESGLSAICTGCSGAGGKNVGHSRPWTILLAQRCRLLLASIARRVRFLLHAVFNTAFSRRHAFEHQGRPVRGWK